MRLPSDALQPVRIGQESGQFLILAEVKMRLGRRFTPPTPKGFGPPTPLTSPDHQRTSTSLIRAVRHFQMVLCGHIRKHSFTLPRIVCNRFLTTSPFFRYLSWKEAVFRARSVCSLPGGRPYSRNQRNIGSSSKFHHLYHALSIEHGEVDGPPICGCAKACVESHRLLIQREHFRNSP